MFKKILISLVIVTITILLVVPFTRVNAATVYTVNFNPSGGTVSPSTKQVTYGESYGELPVPENNNQQFLGWFRQTYTPLAYDEAFEDNHFGRHVVRLATGNPTSVGSFEDGDIVEFDVTINNTLPIGVDINDNDLPTNNYTIDGNRIYGSATIDGSHYAKWGRNSYSFVDINCQDTVTSYTVNEFKLIKTTDGEVEVKSDSIHNVQSDVELYAKWDVAPASKTYTLTSGDGTVIFDFSEGFNFVLSFIDALKLTSEEVEQGFGVTAEYFEQIKQTAIDNTKPYGNLLRLYAITIDETSSTVPFGYSDALTLKIKLTDDLKKYESFKLVYLDDGNGFSASEVIPFEEVDGELVGHLDHLSAYALVGTEKQETPVEPENTTNNPQTSDNIIFDIIMLAFSLLGLVLGITLLKKQK